MLRRTFLSMLAGLPFLGFLKRWVCIIGFSLIQFVVLAATVMVLKELILFIQSL